MCWLAWPLDGERLVQAQTALRGCECFLKQLECSLISGTSTPTDRVVEGDRALCDNTSGCVFSAIA
jgi:hypothetical protein